MGHWSWLLSFQRHDLKGFLSCDYSDCKRGKSAPPWPVQWRLMERDNPDPDSSLLILIDFVHVTSGESPQWEDREGVESVTNWTMEVSSSNVIITVVVLPINHSKWFMMTMIIIIYPLTARTIGAPRMISPPVPVRHCPLGLGELQACSFHDVVFPPLPLSALSSSCFHCALQDSFGQTWRSFYEMRSILR